MKTGCTRLTNLQSEAYLHEDRLTNPKSEAYLHEDRLTNPKSEAYLNEDSPHQVNPKAYNHLPRSRTHHKPENHKLRHSYHEYEGRTSSATLQPHTSPWTVS